MGFWNVPLVVYFNDKFEFLYVTWEFYICAAENLHDDYFLLHYYDILLADAFHQKQTQTWPTDLSNHRDELMVN